jgi:FAD/FMN-containing dehydrogenase
MASKSDVASSVGDLKKAFSGVVLLPGEDGYDEARRVHNGLIERQPAVVARCAGAADVADAVTLGRSLGLDIAVKGGGHNVAGRSTVDDGLMIDLSMMSDVRVDTRKRHARAAGGATWKGFNRETQLHGLATTGGVVGSTGVAGLTLGGGFGRLLPKHGMPVDKLVSPDPVLADGSIVTANETSHPDLFWAIRGGGGNFGVATSLEYRLHSVGPMMIGGLVAWPFEQARDVLRFFRDFTAELPDELFAVAALLTAPDGVTKLVGIAAGHCGSLPDGEAAVKAIKAFGSPVMDVLGPIPYVALNGMLDDAFPKGARNYWKSHFMDTLSDDGIDAIVGAFAACPTPMGQILLEHFHGAATRIPSGDTAFAMRAPGYDALVLAEWLDPAQDAACIEWARKGYRALEPFVSFHRYLNYLDEDDAGLSALEAAYGSNLPKLREIKKKYDPANLFHMNLNIPPA